MKKLLTVLLAGIILSGCSSATNQETTNSE